MVRRIIQNKILKERRQLVVNCAEMKKDDLFDIEECAEFLTERNKLTRHNTETLPEGPLKIQVKKEESKIYMDVGVDVRKVYFKHLVKHYLHQKGLKDWIRVQVDATSGEYVLSFYNVNDE